MKDFLSRLIGGHRRDKPATPAHLTLSTPTAVEGYVAAALLHHGAGRLAEAEPLYRRALALDAENFDALHMLGVAQLQAGHGATAVELIERAIALAPENGVAHSNLGLAYQSQGRLDAAVESLRKAIAVQPDWDTAQVNLGTVLRALGRVDAAEACFMRAVQLNPANVAALNNLGNLYKERGQFAAAEQFHSDALALDPTALLSWKSLGEVYRLAGRLDDALACSKKALELCPEDPGTLADMGAIHAARAELPEAESYFRLALEFEDNRPDVMCNLGDVLRRLDRLDEAEVFCRKAVAMRPDDPDVLNTLACVLIRTGAIEEAEACSRKAISVRSDHVLSQITLGNVLNAGGRSGEAEVHFRSAIRLQPRSATARYNLSMLQLLRGNYKEGLELYESRFDVLQSDFGLKPAMKQLLGDPRRWNGEALSGQRLLVWTEQGFGDSLMMLRYLPLLTGRGAGTVIVLCEQELERVVGSLAGIDNGLRCAQSVAAGEFDLHCPIMSLPRVFDTTLDSIPGVVPYVAVPEPLCDVWKARLSSITKTRVGLAWAGSRTLRDDARRSIPLSAFQPVIKCESVQVVSLQKGDGSEQLDVRRDSIANWMDECVDFLDTAALIKSLDLVITVDSAIAHLAGALGKPVWLLNRYRSEWRWGLESESCPWYPTMRIFRQRAATSWTDVIALIAIELTRFGPARKANDQTWT